MVPRDTLQLVDSSSGQVEAQLHSVILFRLNNSRSSVVVQLGCLEVDPGDDIAPLLHQCHVDSDILRTDISHDEFLVALQNEVFRTASLGDPDPVSTGDAVPGDRGTGWFPGSEHDI